MRGERDYSLREAEAAIEVYGDQLDRISEMLASVLGRAVERRECSAALAGVLDDAPSWQDRPTGPGLWWNGEVAVTAEQWNQWDYGRVFGPIPADKGEGTNG